MNKIKLISPLPITECKAILFEQVQTYTLLLRFGWMFVIRPHSRVACKINGEKIILRYAFDHCSLCLKCTLTESNGQTILNGYWDSSILSDIWGSHKTDKEEILNFLMEWVKFKIAT